MAKSKSKKRKVVKKKVSKKIVEAVDDLIRDRQLRDPSKPQEPQDPALSRAAEDYDPEFLYRIRNFPPEALQHVEAIRKVYDLCDELGASFVRGYALEWRHEDDAGRQRDNGAMLDGPMGPRLSVVPKSTPPRTPR